MPDHDDRPEPVTQTEPAPPPVVDWKTHKLRRFVVSTAVIANKLCRVQELGDGFQAIEVEGLEPLVTEECREVCLDLAERCAYAGYRVRRFVAADGGVVFQ